MIDVFSKTLEKWVPNMESHCGQNYTPITTLSLFHQTLYQIPNTTPNFISNTKHNTKIHIIYQHTPSFINTKHNPKLHIKSHTIANTKHITKFHINYQKHHQTSYQIPNTTPNIKNKLHMKKLIYYYIRSIIIVILTLGETPCGGGVRIISIVNKTLYQV